MRAAAAAASDDENRGRRTREEVCEEVCEEICREMRRYGWSREFCLPRCLAAETERVRRANEAARDDGSGGDASRWPFV